LPDLKAIFFDIDDTLFSTSDFAERARRNAVRGMIRHGLKIDSEAAWRELREVISEFSSNYDAHFDKLLLRIPPESYAGINPIILVAAGVIGYHETKSLELKPFDDVIGALRILSRSSLILGIISAGLQIKQAEKLIRLGIYPYLRPDAIFISDQIGISKPNVKLYQTACAQLDLEPHQVLYVGDNPRQDIDPCNQLGITTIRSRRNTRYANEEGRTPADYEIQTFEQLLEIVEKDFHIPLNRDLS
jgi:putative hydrolase of the HAD superfamily